MGQNPFSKFPIPCVNKIKYEVFWAVPKLTGSTSAILTTKAVREIRGALQRIFNS